MIPERLQPILDEVRPLAERYEAAGHHVYLVGGIVRDLVLGRLKEDYDLDLRSSPRCPAGHRNQPTDRTGQDHSFPGV